MSALAGLSLVFVVCLVLSTLFTALASACAALRDAGEFGVGEPLDDLRHSLALGELASNLGAASSAALALRHAEGGSADPLAWVGLVLGVTLILLIPCEMIPSSLGAMDPAATIRRWSPWVRPWVWLSRPFAGALTRLSAALRRGVSAGLRAARLTSEDVRSAVQTVEEHHELERVEREMVHSIFTFGETIVREVMRPRLDIVAVEESASFAEVLEVAREAEHSRLPVYRGSLDTVVGVVYVKDLLARRYGLDGKNGLDGKGVDEKGGLEGLVREPFYVPESKKIDELLREFQTRGTHMAIVVDEYGGTAGLVTIEDLLEEIVGEIQDEHDVEEPSCVVEPDGALLVDARMNLDDFGEAVGSPVQGNGFETVGGLVYTLFGRVPGAGEEVTTGNLAFRVAELDGRRILKLRVTRLPGGTRATPREAGAEEEVGP